MIHDPNISDWLREALRTALLRDPVEVANDAETLRTLLLRRVADSEEAQGDDALSATHPRRTCARPRQSRSR